MKYLCTFIIVIISNSIQSQSLYDSINRKLNVGWYIGLNTYDFKFHYGETYPLNQNGLPQSVQVEKTVGYTYGVSADLKLNKFLSLRFEPGITKNKRSLIFPISNNAGDPLRMVSSLYINSPILISTRFSQMKKWSPILFGGLNIAYDRSSNQNSPDDIESGVIRLKALNYNYQVGFGSEIQLSKLKLRASIRVNIGILDEFIHNDISIPTTKQIRIYYDKIEGAQSRAVLFNLTFEPNQKFIRIRKNNQQ